MRYFFCIICLVVISTWVKAQLYFPPTNSNEWETISPSTLGWCQDKVDRLYNLLESNNTKAFILLKDGKIVLEQYFNGHSPSSKWYWASAGKTLTAFIAGIAQQENYLNITDASSKYLGEGWTSCTASQEEKITVRHQLTMTSGLDDGVSDPFCTASACLQYLADPGTRWAYHNAPYTLLDNVIENSTGETLNLYTTQKVKNPTGMDGLYIQQEYNNIFYSTARSMARFGLLILNHGNWNGNQILTDTNYFTEMTNTSQDLNESYGYLWWLNGKNSYMVPQSQFVFKGSLNPHAPNDMIAALGKNGQFINVVPSQNMVWIRMGETPDNSLVPFRFNDEIWEYINDLECTSLVFDKREPLTMKFLAYPNPFKDIVHIHSESNIYKRVNFSIFSLSGKLIQEGEFEGNDYKLSLENIPGGLYYLELRSENLNQGMKIVKMESPR